MKFRTPRKLKDLILSIIFAILTFLSCLSNFLKNIRVGRYENLFIFFFLEGNKNCRVGTKKKKKKNRVGRVSGNTDIFLGLK